MIPELLSGPTAAKAAAAIAAGAVALGGLGVAGAAVLDDRPEPARQDVPVLITDEEGPERADGPETADAARQIRTDSQGDEAEAEVDEAELEEIEAVDVDGESGPPADTHGAAVSDAASSGATGHEIAEIARTNETADEASDGRSTAGPDNADNGQAPAERPTPPAETPAGERHDDTPPAEAQQGLDRRPGGSDG